jgi:biopolymer transport protein ExbD
MASHKLPRKSTHIDMTAMCDVAFLLLTFFMLATKFKPNEPVMVRTPTSVSDFPQPDGSILLTVSKDGNTYFDLDNTAAKKELIDIINTEKALNLTQEEKNSFINGSSIGTPFANLKAYLATPSADRIKLPYQGIPMDTTADFATNELAYWIFQARNAGNNTGKNPMICIKSDAGVKYPGFKNIVNTLIKSKIFTFNLLTGLESVPEGTALFDERINGTNAN